MNEEPANIPVEPPNPKYEPQMSIIEEYKEGKRDFVGANLRRANLRCADLRGANLHGANLQHANLRCANLQHADLHGADLQHANLRRADLHGANLRCANLQHADLHGANLQHANLHGANLHGADLHGADLHGADLRNTGCCVIQGLRWHVIKYPTDMQIGCERHDYERWGSFSNDEIAAMDPNALEFWKANKSFLLTPQNGNV